MTIRISAAATVAGSCCRGIDFVSLQHMTNDGDGRDANPSDPGDWVNSTDKADTAFTNCEIVAQLLAWHAGGRDDRCAD